MGGPWSTVPHGYATGSLSLLFRLSFTTYRRLFFHLRSTLGHSPFVLNLAVLLKAALYVLQFLGGPVIQLQLYFQFSIDWPVLTALLRATGTTRLRYIPRQPTKQRIYKYCFIEARGYFEYSIRRFCTTITIIHFYY